VKEATKTDGANAFSKGILIFSSESVEVLFVWNYKTKGINCSRNIGLSFI